MKGLTIFNYIRTYNFCATRHSDLRISNKSKYETSLRWGSTRPQADGVSFQKHGDMSWYDILDPSKPGPLSYCFDNNDEFRNYYNEEKTMDIYINISEGCTTTIATATLHHYISHQ